MERPPPGTDAVPAEVQAPAFGPSAQEMMAAIITAPLAMERRTQQLVQDFQERLSAISQQHAHAAVQHQLAQMAAHQQLAQQMVRQEIQFQKELLETFQLHLRANAIELPDFKNDGSPTFAVWMQRVESLTAELPLQWRVDKIIAHIDGPALNLAIALRVFERIREHAADDAGTWAGVAEILRATYASQYSLAQERLHREAAIAQERPVPRARKHGGSKGSGQRRQGVL
eukprot:m.202247 g.202247  ORF g.202247 m.202247 type:complete len:229 (-) comp10107_c2_seq21:2234-2920(-)